MLSCKSKQNTIWCLHLLSSHLSLHSLICNDSKFGEDGEKQSRTNIASGCFLFYVMGSAQPTKAQHPSPNNHLLMHFEGLNIQALKQIYNFLLQHINGSTTYPCPWKKNPAPPQLSLRLLLLSPKCRSKARGHCQYNKKFKEGSSLRHGKSVHLQCISPPSTVDFCGRTDTNSTPQLFPVSKKIYQCCRLQGTLKPQGLKHGRA